MRFLKTRLFFTIIVVVCLSIAFLSISRANAASVVTNHAGPLASAQGNTSGKMVALNISGGGCKANEIGIERLLACINIDPSGTVRPDGYVLTIPYFNDVRIYIVDGHRKILTSLRISTVPGHFLGNPLPMSPGQVYFTQIWASLPNGGNTIVANSPQQYT